MPGIDSKPPGDVHGPAVSLEQGLAELCFKATERYCGEPPAAIAFEGTFDVVFADHHSIGEARIGDRKPRLRIAGAKRADDGDLLG